MSLILTISSGVAGAACAHGQLAGGFPSVAGRVLHVAVDPNEPPMTFRDPGDPAVISGFNPELVREVANCLDATVAFEILSFNGIVAAVMGGRVDLQFTGMYYEPARAARVDYVNYLVGITGALVAKPAGGHYRTLDDACGAGGGVLIGAFDEILLREQSERCLAAGRKAIELSSYPDTAALVRAAENRRIDLALIGLQVVSEQVRLHPSTLERAFVLKTDLKIGASMSKSRTDLRAAVFAALAELQREGEITRLLRKYALDPAMEIPVEVRVN